MRTEVQFLKKGSGEAERWHVSTLMYDPYVETRSVDVDDMEHLESTRTHMAPE